MKISYAYTMQKFQDWFTQQWVILWGKKIKPENYQWLLGPFGNLNGIGEDFIHQLAEKEKLSIKRNCASQGLIESIHILNLEEKELNQLAHTVIDFYENTSDYQLNFKIKWNPLFIIGGYLVNRLFSQRINQLNIPTNNKIENETITSEIINLINPETNQIKYTIWLRKFKATGKVIYSGIYTTTKIPSGKTTIKAIFPLPKGNATVILKPSIGSNNELILDSSGNNFGDAGFYFLLNDSKDNYWAQYIPSFTDQLIVSDSNNHLQAIQTLKLWNIRVLTLNYKITKI